jgi:hypothetical protein
MVNLKNYNVVPKQFVLLLTFLMLFSCGRGNYNVTKIEGKKIGISEKQVNNAEIESFIKPYREISMGFAGILYCPETFESLRRLN